jgi:hypothetical protein
LSDVGKPLGHQGQLKHDEPSDPGSRLHAKKKTVAASEQNQQDRAAWQGQARQLDAGQLVFSDECGSTIALTPH